MNPRLVLLLLFAFGAFLFAIYYLVKNTRWFKRFSDGTVMKPDHEIDADQPRPSGKDNPYA